MEVGGRGGGCRVCWLARVGWRGLLAGAERCCGQEAPSGWRRLRGRRRASRLRGAEKHAPLTKEQAKELFRSVDEILSFASKDYGAADRAQREAQADHARRGEQVSDGEVR